MVEIMLGVWTICFVLSMTVVAVNFNITKKRLHSKKLQILNVNLEKIGLYWSNSQGDFCDRLANSVEDDKNKSLRNVLLTGFLGLGSVPGFILLFLLVISSHKLARSRKETSTFLSQLAQAELNDTEKIKKIVSEMNQIY